MKPTENFTGKADVYAKFRPTYPNEYIEYLMTANMLKEGSVVADIGSGTGILSRQLLEKGLYVIAVEPNDDMREKAEQTLGRQYSHFRSVNAAAEATALNNKSIDLITVGQAFHWFDHEKFRLECKRILKDGAKAALVWNSRDITYELNKESERICRKYCPNFKGFSGGIDATPEAFDLFFKDGKYDFKSFKNDFVLGFDEFIGRYLSASYSPKKGEREYAFFIAELTNLFENYSTDGTIIFPNITRSYLGNV